MNGDDKLYIYILYNILVDTKYIPTRGHRTVCFNTPGHAETLGTIEVHVISL